MSQLFASGGQSTGASISASALPVNIQGCFPLGLTGLISLQSQGLSRVFSSNTDQMCQFFGISLLYGPTFISIHDYWINITLPTKTHIVKALTIWVFVGKVMSLPFNTLSMFVLTFFQRVEPFNFMAAVTICNDFGTQ